MKRQQILMKLELIADCRYQGRAKVEDRNSFVSQFLLLIILLTQKNIYYKLNVHYLFNYQVMFSTLSVFDNS